MPRRTGSDRATEFVRVLPAPHTVLFVALAVVLAGISWAKGVYDNDYFWHVTTGRLIAAEGIPRTDPFSFTYGGPWTTHEWLSELGLFWMVNHLGETAALVGFGLMPGIGLALLGRSLAGWGVRTPTLALAGVLCAAVIAPHVTARPQVISWLLLAALVSLLMRLRESNALIALVLLPPFFALWANLHGLYVIGLGILSVYTMFTVAGRTEAGKQGRVLLVTLALAVFAAAATPAGLPGLLYPLRYVDAGDWGLANINEWQSPDFHEPLHLPFLALILGVVIAGRRGVPGWLATVGYIGIVMGLLALRNAPVAAILGMPTLAIALGQRAGMATVPDHPPVTRVVRRTMEIGLGFALTAAALVVLANQAPGIRAGLSDNFPRQAVSELERRHPDANVFVEYSWGGFVIFELADEGAHVFVDGRNDMYPQSILEDYSAVRRADPGWEEIARRHDVEAILLRADAALVRGPASNAGWCEIYEDHLQVLLLAPHSCGS